MSEKQQKKNIKISLRHHDMLKELCDGNGTKIYRVIEKLIENLYNNKKLPNSRTDLPKRDIYGEV